MTDPASRLRQILLCDPTGNVRFFFGLITIGYAVFMPQAGPNPVYQVALQWVSPFAWSALFAINGVALVYGSLTNRPSRIMYCLEGWLGVSSWMTLGIATAIAQGMPGPTLFLAFIAGWVLVRYPEWK